MCTCGAPGCLKIDTYKVCELHQVDKTGVGSWALVRPALCLPVLMGTPPVALGDSSALNSSIGAQSSSTGSAALVDHPLQPGWQRGAERLCAACGAQGFSSEAAASAATAAAQAGLRPGAKDDVFADSAVPLTLFHDEIELSLPLGGVQRLTPSAFKMMSPRDVIELYEARHTRDISLPLCSMCMPPALPRSAKVCDRSRLTLALCADAHDFSLAYPSCGADIISVIYAPKRADGHPGARRATWRRCACAWRRRAWMRTARRPACAWPS